MRLSPGISSLKRCCRIPLLNSASGPRTTTSRNFSRHSPITPPSGWTGSASTCHASRHPLASLEAPCGVVDVLFRYPLDDVASTASEKTNPTSMDGLRMRRWCRTGPFERSSPTIWRRIERNFGRNRSKRESRLALLADFFVFRPVAIDVNVDAAGALHVFRRLNADTAGP